MQRGVFGMIRKVPNCNCLNQQLQLEYGENARLNYIAKMPSAIYPNFEIWVSVNHPGHKNDGYGATIELPAHFCCCCGQVFNEVEVPDDD